MGACEEREKQYKEDLEECVEALEAMGGSTDGSTTVVTGGDSGSSSSTSSKTYADTMTMVTVSADMMEDVDDFTMGKIGIEGLKQYEGQFYLPADKAETMYAPTCVAYGASGDACDGTKLVCAGAGGTYGFGPQMANNLNEALGRVDLEHPRCPTGCNDLGSWWADTIKAAGVDETLCLVGGEALYVVEDDGSKTSTCVGLGDEATQCPNSDLVCSGMKNGFMTFGYPQNIIKSLKVALEQDGDKHPQCPECCGCD